MHSMPIFVKSMGLWGAFMPGGWMLFGRVRIFILLAKTIKPFPMRILSTFFFVFLSTIALGQFAIIQDKDGYCNVRSSAETGDNIVGKLGNGHLVFCFEKEGNWINIDYTKNGKELSGYVYHDRLKLISEFSSVPLQKKMNNNVTFSKDSIQVIVTQQEFDKSKSKPSYHQEAKDQIELINGKQYWGTDGELPKSEYKSIVADIGQRKIILPKAALENLFEPSLYNTEVSYDNANNILYIQSMNSDGAGSYYIIWKIENGIYKDRYIAYGF